MIYRRKLAEVSEKRSLTAEDSDFCAVKRQCRSCIFINESYETTLKKKFDAAVASFPAAVLSGANIAPVHPSSKIFNYRSHVKLAVRQHHGSDKRFAIGLFEPGSHRVVDLSTCPVQSHPINDLLTDLRPILEASELEPYNEQTQTGDLRYLAIRSSHVTDTLLLSFVVRRDVRRLLKQLATDLRRTRHKISGIFMNLHEENNNKIFGDTEVHISGQKKLRENLCDLSFEISPTAFFQVNPWTAEIIYRRIEQLAGNTAHFSTAWDLFSGMGQIAMILARSGYQVCSIEENPAAVADAEQNFHLNELSGKVHALCGRTEEVQYQIPKAQLQPDLIVANPSRKGIPPATIDFIVNAMKSKKNAQFIYLSCDHQTLMRDLQLLVDQGMRLRQLEAFDMFPFTDKLEWIGVVTL